MVLFFVIFLMTMSAHSAADAADDAFFSQFIGTREHQNLQRVYLQDRDGKPRKVVVSSTWLSADEREVTIEKPDTQERLVLKLGFSRKKELLQTCVCYGDESVIVSSSADLRYVPDKRSWLGVGILCILARNYSKTLPVRTPVVAIGETHDIERPDYEGIINGNADRIDVTQYLFKCDAAEGHFVRMSVRYANIGAVQLAWGQERYYGVQQHGNCDAKTSVVGKKVFRFTDAPAPEFPEPVQYRHAHIVKKITEKPEPELEQETANTKDV